MGNDDNAPNTLLTVTLTQLTEGTQAVTKTIGSKTIDPNALLTVTLTALTFPQL
jgi:hypothetical protein